MSNTDKYPFVYCGHGTAFAKNDFYMAIGFRHEVPAEARKEIKHAAPPPFNDAKWKSDYLEYELMGSDGENDRGDWYAREVREAISGKSGPYKKPTATEWQALEERINVWLMETHSKFPIAFVAKSSIEFEQGKFSAWHSWSTSQYESQVAPFVAKLKSRAAKEQIRSLFLRGETPPSEIRDDRLRTLDDFLQKQTLKQKSADYNPGATALEMADSALGKGKARLERLSALHPISQLVYFTWHGAYHHGQSWKELTSLPGWPTRLREILGALRKTKYREASERLLEILCTHLPKGNDPSRFSSE